MFDRDEQEISQIIDNGLEAIRAGRATLEQVLEQQELRQHPAQVEAIRAELEAGLWLMDRREEVEARPGFVSASRKRVLERIQAEARSQGAKHAFFGFAWPKRIALQWAAAALVVVLFFTGAGGVVKASQVALPGDNLYAVKRASEQVAYTVTLSDVKRTELSKQFAEKRLNEVEKLIAGGKYPEAEQTLVALQKQVNQTVALLARIDNTQAQAKLSAAEEFKADLTRNSGVLTNLMASAPPDVLDKLQNTVTVMDLNAAATDEIIRTIPVEKVTPTPTSTKTPTGTAAGTETPEAMDTPEPNEPPVSDGLNTPSTGSFDEDETPTPTLDASKTPKPSHTPKDNTSNNSLNKPDKKPPKDKPPKDPPPGQTK